MTLNPKFGKDDEANAAHFSSKVVEHEQGHLAVDWGSRRSQQLRFETLYRMLAIREGCSIVDVGCGLAGFLEYLAANGVRVDYTGVDLSTEMISRCRARFPEARFVTGSFLDLPETRADHLVASGIFNLRTEHPWDFLQETVSLMYRSCNEGVAFNCLSTRATHRQPGEFHVDPERALRMCRQLGPDVTLDHSYLAHDFTIALKKPS